MCILSLATHHAAGEHVLQSRKNRVKKFWQRLHRVAALEEEASSASPCSPTMALGLTGSGSRSLKGQRSVTFSLEAPDEMTYFCEVPFADEHGICSDDE